MRGFSTEEDMVERIRRDCKDGDKCMITGGIVFTNLPTDGETLPSNIQYKIRVHGRSQQGEVNRTRVLFHSKNTSAPRNFEKGGKFTKLTTHLKVNPVQTISSVIHVYSTCWKNINLGTALHLIYLDLFKTIMRQLHQFI